MARPASTAEVVAAVAELAARTRGETVFVGIDGPGAAGKTTLAAAVGRAVLRAVVVHVDDFAGPGVTEWDWQRFRAQVAAPLAAGRPARYQVWDWDLDAGGEWCAVPVGSVVVVEGVSSTRREAGVGWALQVWVDAPRETRLRRARERDGPALLPRWLEEWMPSEEAYIARERPQHRVDLLLDGTAR